MKKVFGRQEDDSSAMSIQDLKIEGSDDEKYNKTTLKKRRPSNEDWLILPNQLLYFHMHSNADSAS